MRRRARPAVLVRKPRAGRTWLTGGGIMKTNKGVSTVLGAALFLPRLWCLRLWCLLLGLLLVPIWVQVLAAPTITITSLPAYGASGLMCGSVAGVADPSQYQV